MIPLAQLSKRAGRLVVDNSPAILTSAAVAGVLSTAVLAAKGSFKAAHILENEDPHETVKEQAQRVWKCYIPAAITGSATIAFVIGANHISSKRAAAALSLYSLSETALREYKDKVVEQIGANKEQKIRDEVAQDRVTKTAPAAVPTSTEVVIVGKSVLCMELMSGRYFRSDVESIRKAQNDFNQMVLSDFSAPHNDFLNMIGLESSGYGEEVGWNIDNLIEIQFSTVMTPEGEPCLAIGYATWPKDNYHKIGG